MKKYFIVLQFVILASILISCDSHEPSPRIVDEHILSLHLSLDKHIYHIDEPIYVKLTLENIGDSDILIKERMVLNYPGSPIPFWDVIFMLESKSGKQPAWEVRVNAGFVKTDEFSVLGPGKVIEIEYDLQRFYLLEEGEYSLFALYQNSVDPGDGRQAWRGVLSSNSENFVLKP